MVHINQISINRGPSRPRMLCVCLHQGEGGSVLSIIRVFTQGSVFECSDGCICLTAFAAAAPKATVAFLEIPRCGFGMSLPNRIKSWWNRHALGLEPLGKLHRSCAKHLKGDMTRTNSKKNRFNWFHFSLWLPWIRQDEECLQLGQCAAFEWSSYRDSLWNRSRWKL